MNLNKGDSNLQSHDKIEFSILFLELLRQFNKLNRCLRRTALNPGTLLKVNISLALQNLGNCIIILNELLYAVCIFK